MRSEKLYKIREKIIEVLKNLAEQLDAKVYLFGSYARGDHLLDSDVDIVVVSQKFSSMNYVDRVALVREKLPAEIGFDIIPLTPEELIKRRGFISEIAKDWIEINP
ncbi:MAG: nucleotidyltransferase domain-containing protein [Nitrososphaerales archaeon]|nr:nucleotidyltransferase domain-containing protein [Nitrososphaerales archaeon]